MKAKDDNEMTKETADTLQLTFDKFQRYKVVADIINKFRKNKEIFKILEGGEETLKRFLPHDHFIFLDKELLPEDRQKSNYILGDITEMHIVESYDFVVSIDTYEHIHPSSRERFINELIHPSNIATIIAAPFDTPGVKESEVIVNEAYVLTYDTEYRWLHEHIQNGNLYQYDSISPAYRQVIIIKKEGRNPDFSDILTKDFNSVDFKIKYEMLQSILTNIRALYNPYRYNQIKTLENNLQEKERQIEELNVAVREKDTQLRNFDELKTTISSYLKEKDKQIDELDITIQESDEQIRDLEEQITAFYGRQKEKEQRITELNVALQGKDKQILNLDGQIANISGQRIRLRTSANDDRRISSWEDEKHKCSKKMKPLL
jgi:hypothetical protein